MLRYIFGIRFIALFGMFLMAALAIGLAWYSAQTYERFAFDNQQANQRQLIRVQSKRLIEELQAGHVDLGNQLSQNETLLTSMARQEGNAARANLEQILQRLQQEAAYANLHTIALRNRDIELVTGAYRQPAMKYNGCPALLDRARNLGITSSLKPLSGLCSHDGGFFAEFLLPLNTGNADGVLHFVSRVHPQLMRLESQLKLPLRIRNGESEVLYQAGSWQESAARQAAISPISVTLFGDDNVPGLHIDVLYDFSEFVNSTEDTGFRILMFAVAVAASVLLVAVLLLALAFRPLDTMRSSIGALLDGTYSPIRIKNLPMELTEFVTVYNEMVGGLQDAFGRQDQAERDLIKERDFISTTLDSITNAVIVVNALRLIKLANPAAEKLLEDNEDNLYHQSLDDLMVVYTNRSATHIADLKKLLKNPRQAVNLFMQRDGKIIELEMTASPMIDDEAEDVGHVLIFKDVTEDRKLRRKLNYEGSHDKLTGLLNRAAFERKFDSMVSDTDYTQNQHIMVYLNVDQFGVVNDTCGTAAGDLLLKHVAAVLRDNIRKSDIIARLGGDEFGMVLSYAEAATACNTVNDILVYIHQGGFNWHDKEFSVSARAALIPFGLASDDFSSKLAKLTAASSIAKDNGGNQYYQIGDDDEKVQEHHSTIGWVSGINLGFTEERFKLYCQPIVPLSQKAEKAHYEILIRYQEEDDTIIPPAEFLPPAERFNLIERIDRWVVSEVINYLSEHPEYQDRVQFSINLSGRSIGSEGFHRFLVQLLNSEEVDATALCFEITETAAVKDVAKSIEFIRVIKQIGARFSLDDFGSGLSSFTYLKQFPVDYLKIDGSFIKDILHDAQSYDFVRSITEVGHCLGMKVVAEYVDSRNMFHTLREAKVDYLQGYTIGKPAPLAELDLDASKD